MLVIAGSCLAKKQILNQPVFDLNRHRKTDMSEMIAELKKKRIILVGEHHSDRRHHEAQLAIIQALKQSGVKVAIGLEMFRDDSQSALDKWIAGELDPRNFETISKEHA